jgi:hypothetical protein
MAKEYFLYTRPQGSTAWTYSGYQIKLSGNVQNSVVMHYRTYDKSNPPSGGWNTPTGAGLGYNGNGNPDNPQNGDGLDLPSSIGNATNLTGGGDYDSAGSNNMGAGYYPGGSPTGDDNDWCATTS